MVEQPQTEGRKSWVLVPEWGVGLSFPIFKMRGVEYTGTENFLLILSAKML